MMEGAPAAVRLLPAARDQILVEFQSLQQSQAMFAALNAEPVLGIRTMIPAARTLMIRFNPRIIDAAELGAVLATRNISGALPARGRDVVIPVSYDGADLADVARLTGLSVSEVIRRHQAASYQVAFCGFAPGFAYLTGGDPALFVPRRGSPRAEIAAGALALGGEFCGIYPANSPGGWQIIGRAHVGMFEITRDPPALLQPGDRVRFEERAAPEVARRRVSAVSGSTDSEIAVTASLFPATFQDLGRPGRTGDGISASGAMDRGALSRANRLVGNPAGMAALELTLGGFAFRIETAAVVALSGAPSPIRVRDAAGRTVSFAADQAIALDPGDEVEIGTAARGLRSYLAIRGGYRVEPVLGSASTDCLAMIGPAAVKAGDRLGLNRMTAGLDAVSLFEAPPSPLPAAGETVTLDVVLGPRTDWFSAAGLQTFLTQAFEVTPASSRVGIRLRGPSPIERAITRELPSEATVKGAIQLPHEGQPVLFLADHPLTGGYPVIGSVADYHHDLAGQLPPGAFVRFRALQPFADILPNTAERTP